MNNDTQKRFLLFVMTNTPHGGFDDCVNSFDTCDEAHQYLETQIYWGDKAQIFDCASREKVWEGLIT
jgi:hypothetical protein